MNIAYVTLVRDDPATATILSNRYVEEVRFYKITWAPRHVVFHFDERDENRVVAYRADRVYELVTEEYKDG